MHNVIHWFKIKEPRLLSFLRAKTMEDMHIKFSQSPSGCMIKDSYSSSSSRVEIDQLLAALSLIEHARVFFEASGEPAQPILTRMMCAAVESQRWAFVDFLIEEKKFNVLNNYQVLRSTAFAGPVELFRILVTPYESKFLHAPQDYAHYLLELTRDAISGGQTDILRLLIGYYPQVIERVVEQYSGDPSKRLDLHFRDCIDNNQTEMMLLLLEQETIQTRLDIIGPMLLKRAIIMQRETMVKQLLKQEAIVQALKSNPLELINTAAHRATPTIFECLLQIPEFGSNLFERHVIEYSYYGRREEKNAWEQAITSANLSVMCMIYDMVSEEQKRILERDTSVLINAFDCYGCANPEVVDYLLSFEPMKSSFRQDLMQLVHAACYFHLAPSTAAAAVEEKRIPLINYLLSQDEVRQRLLAGDRALFELFNIFARLQIEQLVSQKIYSTSNPMPLDVKSGYVTMLADLRYYTHLLAAADVQRIESDFEFLDNLPTSLGDNPRLKKFHPSLFTSEKSTPNPPELSESRRILMFEKINAEAEKLVQEDSSLPKTSL